MASPPITPINEDATRHKSRLPGLDRNPRRGLALPGDDTGADPPLEVQATGAAVSLSAKRPTAPASPSSPAVRKLETTDATTASLPPESIQMENVSEDISSAAPPSSPAIMWLKTVDKRGPLQDMAYHMALGHCTRPPNDVMAVPELHDLVIAEVMKTNKRRMCNIAEVMNMNKRMCKSPPGSERNPQRGLDLSGADTNADPSLEVEATGAAISLLAKRPTAPVIASSPAVRQPKTTEHTTASSPSESVQGAAVSLLAKRPTATASRQPETTEAATALPPEFVQKRLFNAQIKNVSEDIFSAAHPSSPAIMQWEVVKRECRGAAMGLLAKRPTATALSSSPAVRQPETTEAAIASSPPESVQIKNVSEHMYSAAPPSSPTIMQWKVVKRECGAAAVSLLAKRPTAPASPSPVVRQPETTEAATLSLLESVQMKNVSEEASSAAPPSSPAIMQWKVVKKECGGAAVSLLAKRPTATASSSSPAVRQPETTEAATALSPPESVQMNNVSEDTSSAAPPSSPAIMQWKVVKRKCRGAAISLLEKRPTATASPSSPAVQQPEATVKIFKRKFKNASEDTSASPPSPPTIMQWKFVKREGRGADGRRLAKDISSAAPLSSPAIMRWKKRPVRRKSRATAHLAKDRSSDAPPSSPAIMRLKRVIGAAMSVSAKRPTDPASSSSPAIRQPETTEAATLSSPPVSVQGAAVSLLAKRPTATALSPPESVQMKNVSADSSSAARPSSPAINRQKWGKVKRKSITAIKSRGAAMAVSSTRTTDPASSSSPAIPETTEAATVSLPPVSVQGAAVSLLAKRPTATALSPPEFVQMKNVSADSSSAARPSSPAINRQKWGKVKRKSITAIKSRGAAMGVSAKRPTDPASSSSPAIRQPETTEAATVLSPPVSVQGAAVTLLAKRPTATALSPPESVQFYLFPIPTAPAIASSPAVQQPNMREDATSLSPPDSVKGASVGILAKRPTATASSSSPAVRQPETTEAATALSPPVSVQGAAVSLLAKRPTATALSPPESVQMKNISADTSSAARPSSPAIMRQKRVIVKRNSRQGGAAMSVKAKRLTDPASSSSPAIRQPETTEAATVSSPPVSVQGAAVSLLAKRPTATASSPPESVQFYLFPIPTAPAIASSPAVQQPKTREDTTSSSPPDSVKGAAVGPLAKRPTATASSSSSPAVRQLETTEAATALSPPESVQMENASGDTSSAPHPSSPAIMQRKKGAAVSLLAKRPTATALSPPESVQVYLFPIPTAPAIASSPAVQQPKTREDTTSSSPPNSVQGAAVDLLAKRPTATASSSSSPAVRQLETTEAATALSPPNSVQMENVSEDASSAPRPSSPAIMRRKTIRLGKRGPLQKIAYNAAKGHYTRLPNDIMAVPGLYDLVVAEVMKRIKEECANVTRLAFGSVLRKTSPQSLKTFCWEDVVEEWRIGAPTFLKFLQSAASVSFDDPTPTDTSERKKKKHVAAMAGAMVLHARSRRMRAPMVRNSLLLRHTGASKRCFQRFRRQGICVSHKETLLKLKEMGATGDKDACKGIFPEQDVIDERPHVHEATASRMKLAGATTLPSAASESRDLCVAQTDPAET